ncbi:hypothetical protein L3X38_031460 [Prunus dulcis]|uniref:SWIM-type domain-containing protein n=1 Tax=Prunus dulcis TaxID=3755 RepID=A0AAD4YVN1_PRUDU|nr:hypothetical protein L3X38_031460 [Prunus dulcis]
MLPSHRRISTSQATEVDLTEESGIPLRQAYEFMDCDEQITNIFWADAKMIVDYGQFGDFVCFDTTYKTNNEANRPFGVFVGSNHHREIPIFGASLWYDETTNSFIWLFETFLEAMSKKAPKTLFTDQDAAMAKACAHVMPNTYHRLCTWHIMQNAMKHVNNLFRRTGGVRSVLTQFMDYYEEKDEFLVAWESMLDEYNVRGHPWLESIFDLRKKWAMAYCKWSLSAGVKTTQISESFNATLKDCSNVDHDVVQFFMHFERVGNIYTKAIFEDFQAQYIKSLELDMISCDKDGDDLAYTVVLHCNSKERCVRKQKDGDVSCSCRLFEMKGFLCSHALKILTNYMNVKEIPDQYILKRWTRKARSISSRAAESEETYKIYVSHLNQLSKTIEDMLSSKMDGQVHDKNGQGSPSTIVTDGANEACFLGSAKVIQARGLKKREAT